MNQRTSIEWTERTWNPVTGCDRVSAGFEFIAAVFATMAETPQHTYQVLTKRSARLLRLAPRLPWPANVWMGVSVESQEQVIRAERLIRVPAAVRFLSVEPMLGPVDLGALLWSRHRERPGRGVEMRVLSWVIAGGESGPGCRPCHLDWLRALRDQCQRAKVAFFLKQLGGWPDKRGQERALLDGRLWREMPPQRPVEARE